MDKRTLIAIVLSLALVMLYQYLFVKPVAVQKPADQAKQETAVSATTTPGATPEATPGPEAPTRQRSLFKREEAVVPGKDITVDTPLYTAVFSTRGGALRSMKLKNYKTETGPSGVPVEMVSLKPEMTYPLTTGFSDSTVEIDPNVLFEADRETLTLSREEGSETLTFSWTYPGEITLEKRYTFHADSYLFDLDLTVRNLSDGVIRQTGLLSWNHYVDPNREEDSYGFEGPVYYYKDDVDTLAVKKIKSPQTIGPDISWGGYESKYFIAAMISQQPPLTSLVLSREGDDRVSVDLEGPRNVIPPQQAGSFRYALYVGPKDHTILKSVGAGLENAIDFGSWIKWLALPLLKALKFIYGFVHNYGLAIIILTLFVKILFWPLGNMSYRSMKGMQKLQPKINELREKYKDDKARLNQEVMSLYKIHKVNPMSGCLPIFIQIPVFFGLYKALLYAIELRHAPFVFWISDLSAKDPYYITPILMGATMFLQQKMTPSSGSDMQQKMMMWMPIIFTFLFLSFPSGLVLYWLFNNVLSIGQQYYVNRQKS